jgi:ABC-type molybdate transport system substrate-binding protein
MSSTTVRLFSGLAVKDILEDVVLPPFLSETGIEVERTYEPTSMLLRLIDEGAQPDVILGVHASVTDLAHDGTVDADSVRPLVRSGIGVAVPPDAPLPAITTIDEFVATLQGARSVAYSATGASGVHFAALLEQLDIAADVNARACILPKGFTAEALLDGRADLAIQQVIELAAVPGVRIVGPLPAGAQHYVELSIAAAAQATPATHALLAHLSSPFAREAYTAAGLDAVPA